MLQQTQVKTVIPYWERWMRELPTIHAAAQASPAKLHKLWEGLGYYTRVRNLQKAAQQIVAQHGGRFPENFDDIHALPGIGRYTAGAIASIAFNQPRPILDGNVKRVLTRYFGIDGFPGEQKIERELWRLADECTPAERVADYTQAIMDLGATVCVRSRPLCAVCPLQEHCVARIEHRQSSLPTPRPKKVRPQRVAYAVVAVDERGAVLLERRPATGLWGGLWTFPQFEARDDAHDHAMNLGEVTQRAGMPGAYRHAFTHFDLTLHPIVVTARPASHGVGESDRHLWYDPRRPAKVGLAKPAVDLIAMLAPDATNDGGSV